MNQCKKRWEPILVQLPPSLKFNNEVTENFFEIIKKNYFKYTFALEVRHNTWLKEESFTLLRKYDIAFVISQSGKRFPCAEMVTAKNIYVRLHGRHSCMPLIMIMKH